MQGERKPKKITILKETFLRRYVKSSSYFPPKHFCLDISFPSCENPKTDSRQGQIPHMKTGFMEKLGRKYRAVVFPVRQVWKFRYFLTGVALHSFFVGSTACYYVEKCVLYGHLKWRTRKTVKQYFSNFYTSNSLGSLFSLAQEQELI